MTACIPRQPAVHYATGACVFIVADIGNLHPKVSVADLEPKLIKYGTITNLWVAKNPPGLSIHRRNSECIDRIPGKNAVGRRNVPEAQACPRNFNFHHLPFGSRPVRVASRPSNFMHSQSTHVCPVVLYTTPFHALRQHNGPRSFLSFVLVLVDIISNQRSSHGEV